MKHEWSFDPYSGKNAKGETPKHHENVKVHLKDGRTFLAWYDMAGWFRGMQGGFIHNVIFWEKVGESE